ncbi:peptide/nickel transport system permease protein [Deinobacterium chartae]|uniref:Peptide/nickel transport system permease protein n=1 Tax=Deinobacterium chartae TaxID=521158 RepID=A0A841I6N1_9DEIO|nr:ABC transporter permease [Deinobacterium chartae]MBB6099552.1 peptide/nickel transport system permease protein [Deinobacterium chartae]
MNIIRKTLRKPIGMIGFILICLFLIVALFAPVIAPIPPEIVNYGQSFSIPNRMLQDGFSPIPVAPSSEHIFGLAQDGYDIFFGVVWGTRGAFLVGILVTGISMLVGLIVGTLAGYFGGWLDMILMRFTDIVFAFPSLVLLIVIVVLLGRDLVNIMLAIALVNWGQYARIVRSEVLKVRSLEYVDAARALGAIDQRIIFKHVLPNSITSLLVLVSLDIGTVVVTAAALSFLGIGAPAGFPDWGQLINMSRAWLSQPQYWFTWLYPGLAIVLFVVAWNMFGDALRDAADPRSK